MFRKNPPSPSSTLVAQQELAPEAKKTHSSRMIRALNDLHGRPLRLLLVMPQFPPSFWGMQYVARYFGKTCMMPPLGLLTLAGMCPDNWEVRVADENVEELADEDIQWADLLGITSMIVQYDNAVRISRRARFFGKPTLVGGPHSTGEKEAYENEFDILVLNEGEITFREFIGDYKKGSVNALYQTDKKADMSDTPVARYDLLRHPKKYINFSLQFSRGCPYGCEFCDVMTFLGRKHRTKPLEIFLKDLDSIFACGYRGPVFIADDNFAIQKDKVIDLCQAMEKWNKKHGYPFVYYTEMSVESAKHEDLLDALQKARFVSMYFGFETPNRESLECAGKHHNLSVDVKDLIRRVQSRGIRVDSGFIVGFDNDDSTIFDRQARFIEDIGVCTAMVGVLSPLPSTPLHRRLRESGRLLHEKTKLDLFGLDIGYNLGGRLNIQPLNFSKEELLAGYARLIGEVYSPTAYFARLLKQISLLKSDRMFLFSVLKWSFVALPLLSLLIVVAYPWRFHYLKAALKAVARHPGSIKEFAFLSMCGIHYIEFTRRDVLPWIEKEIVRIRSSQIHDDAAPACM